MRKPKNGLARARMISLYSQQDVANALGISQPYYGRLERNPESINLGMAMKLKNLFNANSIEELLDAS